MVGDRQVEETVAVEVGRGDGIALVPDCEPHRPPKRAVPPAQDDRDKRIETMAEDEVEAAIAVEVSVGHGGFSLADRENLLLLERAVSQTQVYRYVRRLWRTPQEVAEAVAVEVGRHQAGKFPDRPHREGLERRNGRHELGRQRV